MSYGDRFPRDVSRVPTDMPRPSHSVRVEANRPSAVSDSSALSYIFGNHTEPNLSARMKYMKMSVSLSYGIILKLDF